MLKLGYKFKKFLKLNPFKNHIDEEILEGQTSAGKTTVGIGLKFILLVSLSPKKIHLLCGYTMGKLENSIIVKENGILDIARTYGYEVEYNSNGKGDIRLPHLVVKGNTKEEDKIIYCAGYSDTTKWKDILGNQYGIVAVDEANIADIDFLRELSMRRDYWMLTLNPDNPDLEIYKEFINRSRPLEEFKKDYPEELMNQLLSVKHQKSSVHWYFTMDDNAALSEEKKAQIRNSVPVGSKQYKNKILGLRGRAEGLVFKRFDRSKQVIDVPFEMLTPQFFREKILRPYEQVAYIFDGLDSGIEKDATALVTILVTTASRLIILPSMYYDCSKNNDLSNAPSNQAATLEKWLDTLLNRVGLLNPASVKICSDSAAVTNATAKEINLRTHYRCLPVEKKDRINDTLRAIGIIEKENFVTIINCGNIDPVTFKKIGDTDMFIVEIENQVWDKKKGNVPEDGNDHCIDAFKYGTYQIYNGGIY